MSEPPSANITSNWQLSVRLSVLIERLSLADAQEDVGLLDSHETRGADLIGCRVQTQLCCSNNASTVGTAGTGYVTVQHRQVANKLTGKNLELQPIVSSGD